MFIRSRPLDRLRTEGSKEKEEKEEAGQRDSDEYGRSIAVNMLIALAYNYL